VEAVYLTFIFMLAVLLGVELINKVPATLHTPLMSGSNAISGITLVGALISSTVIPQHETLTSVLATAAVFFATINVVGGYVVTDRMLAMFKKTPGGK
jgi:NAD(P) transhydrogenase subunit alpha